MPAPHVVLRMDLRTDEYRSGVSNLCFSSPINHALENGVDTGPETYLLPH
jgi:hypothetical protein